MVRWDVAEITGWKSRCLAPLFAKVDPAPGHAVARRPTLPASRAENRARKNCPDAGGGPPARYPAHHAPALSCDWRGGWQTDKHSAAAPHRTPRPPAPARFRCRRRGFGAGAHVHGLSGEPDGVDADHRNRSRRKVAQAAAFSVGQFTLTVPRGCGISRQIVAAVISDRDVGDGNVSGMKAGCRATVFCDCSRIHLWTRFALRLWPSATLAIEAPGSEHS